ncbi:MAG: calcium-binding protein [Pseudomonadota bacterium]
MLIQNVQNATSVLGGINVNAGTYAAAGGTLASFLANLPALSQGFSDSYHGKTGSDMVASLIGDPLLTFPFAEQPISIIQLLLNKDIDLFKLVFPTINIPLGMDPEGNVTAPIPIGAFPIFPLPLITGQIGVAAQVLIDLAVGFDTTGLRLYAANGFTNPSQIFRGFYLDDQRNGTVDKAEVIIRAAIDMVIDANFLGVSIGGGGNIVGEVDLNFADSLFGADGRLYVWEIPGVWDTNKLAIFDVSGRVTAGLRAYVNAPWGNVWRWNSERVTLVAFSASQGVQPPGPPAGLADIIASDLWINIGNRANQRDITDKTDDGEQIEISALADGAVLVSGFATAQLFTAFGGTIQIDANAGADQVYVDESLNYAMRVTGGAGADTLQGGALADQLFGGTEDDWLLGRAGNDTLRGEDGNDYLEGGAGADVIDGGAGDYDAASYANAEAAITLNLATGVHGGDAAGDTFTSVEIYEGSRFADTMIGDAGTNRLNGLGGNDTIDGAGGNDVLSGGPGNNIIDGGTGYDIAFYLASTTGVTVTMSGTSGTVTAGPAGNRTIDDTLTNIEEVVGTAAADTMIGGAGAQVFTGDAGNDTLNGGADDDTLIGGVGADTLIGGDGIDTASYIGATASVTLTLASGGSGGEATGDSFSGVENVIGSSYGDVIGGDAGANRIDGGLGADTLNGADGDDVLIGGVGADALNGGTGFDTASYITATSAITLDRVAGTASGDALGDSFAAIEAYEGSNYNDVIRGSNQSAATTTSIITVTADNQDAAGTGQPDNDVGVSGAWTAALPVEFDIITPTVFATTSATLTINAIDVDPRESGRDPEYDEVLVNGISIGFLRQGATASDAPSVSTFAIDPALLVAGRNRVTIRNVNDTGAGSFTFTVVSASLSYAAPVALEEIRGGLGNDTLFGAGGIDRLLGGDGDDTLDGEGDGDILDGGAGTDTLYGRAGTDVLDGGIGDDILWGGDDADRLHGSAGQDVLHGDDGDDSLDGGDAADTIDGGAGSDTVDYSGAAAAVYVNLGNVSRNLGPVTLAARTARDGFGFIDGFTIGTSGNSSVENARGGAFADRLAASDDGSLLEGMGGDDILLGGTGIDVLKGGEGADTLNGGDGNDVLMGGAGVDTLVGAGGTDWASYEEDAAGVTASLATGTATDGSGSADTLSTIENLRGSAFADTLTGDAGANRIEGLAGNDMIDGGDGVDVLVGGAGDDIYTVDRADRSDGSNDAVVELGGEGSDLVRSWSNYLYVHANVEDIQLLGTARIAQGNADHNRLIGNAQNNILDGAGGSDTFWGYAGNDTYYFDTLGDTIGTVDAPRSGITGAGEVAGGGTDTIMLATANIFTGPANNPVLVNYSLDTAAFAQVENLTLIDNVRRVDLTGNALNNVLTGNDTSQLLYGGGGDDVLVTGLGDDDVDGGAGLDTMDMDWSTLAGRIIMNVDPTANATTGGFNGEFRAINYNWFDYYTSIERFVIRTGGGSDSIVTATGDDIVYLNDGDDYVNIGSGRDEGHGGGGTDVVTADYRTDAAAIVWNLAADTYSGSGRIFDGFEGFGTLYTGSGNDIVTTTRFQIAETIYLGAGNDRVTLAGGDDDAHGGAGADSYVLDWSWISGRVIMNADPTANTTDGGFNGEFRAVNYNWFNYYTSFERFEIATGGGDDSIVTATGDDIVSLGAGDDFVNIGSGRDEAHGGDGTDRITADYRTDTAAIVWNLQTDSYSGSGRIFDGFEGFGTLYTGSGDDIVTTTRLGLNELIYLGAGNDRVVLAGGDDDVSGGTGLDTLVLDWSWISGRVIMNANPTANAAEGGFNGEFRAINYSWFNYYTSFERFEISTSGGDDSIVTATGDDIVSLGAGDDFVNVGSGRDEAHGGAGTDVITADYRTDSAAILWNLQTDSYSGSGRIFDGFEGFGTLYTGSGNDIVTTTRLGLNELIYLGAGNDRVVLAGGDDDVSGGTGLDTLVLDWSWISGRVIMNANPTANAAEGGFDGDIRAINYSWFDGYTSIERFEISTSGGDDSIVTATGDDIVSLGAGDDVVNVGSGRDEAHGGSGIDVITADYRTDTAAILWNLATDSYSGSGRIFDGFEAFGTLYTGSGNDVVTTTGLALNDLIYLGDGNDRVVLAGGDDDAYGGLGTDTYVLDWSSRTGSVVTSQQPIKDANNTAIGWIVEYRSINDNWFNYAHGFEKFEITTGSANDSIYTADGDDIVRLGAGDDFVNIGSGIDQGDGGTGIDGITANYATDATAILWNLQANSYSGAGRSFVNFEYFGTLYTGSGNDVVTTSKLLLSDIIYLGAGDDRVVLAGGDDDVFGGAGTDTYVLDWSGETGAIVTYQAPTADANGGWTGEYRAVNRNWFNYYASFETFEITTGSGADSIVTGGGNDVIRLGAGNDYGEGGAGNDLLDGGIGDDVLRGGTGDDIYIVDSVFDSVVENAGEGTDEIRTELQSYTMAGIANVERLTGTSTVTGQYLVGNAGNNIITGTAFADTLSGGSGDDQIYGGAGNDRFLMGRGLGDEFFGGDGVDTLMLEGSAGSYEFIDLGDGRVRVRDLRDASPQSIVYLSGFERVSLINGSFTLAQAVARTIPTLPTGGSGNDSVTASAPGAAVDLSQGGDDSYTGATGNEGIYMGATLNAADSINGLSGTNDQVAIQGNYTGANALLLGPTTLVNIEVLALLPGYNYAITPHQATVPAGGIFTVTAQQLSPGESFTFNGGAENDGAFRIFGGPGTDAITTGTGNDGIYFGPGGYDPNLDRVDGGAGTNDQMALDGHYVMTIDGRIQNVEVLVLLAGVPLDLATYDITLADSFNPAGSLRTIYAAPVKTDVRVDASGESDNPYTVYAGAGADTIIGGAQGDTILGGGGGDRLTGGGGADTYLIYQPSHSTGAGYDRITDFAAEDRIDLPVPVTAIGATVTSGALSTATIDADLSAIFGAAQLDARMATLFTPTSGDLAGRTFLVVDGNNVAGYQAGADYLFELGSQPASIGLANFI